MQQREEKQLEASLESLITQVAHIKNALHSFIFKLENEYERLTWPSVLDNFALLSGQLNTINKLLKNDKTPSFRNQLIIPLLLSQDRDDELAKIRSPSLFACRLLRAARQKATEQRVPVFSHEIVPDYLRTKPEPEVEEQEKQLSVEAARIGPEVAQKQIQTLNKLCSSLLEKLSNPRDERDAESAAPRPSKSWFNPADTSALVGAVAFGKGLSKCRPPGPPGAAAGAGGPTLQQVTSGGAAGQLPGGPPQQQGQPGKLPGIKTNIKSASMHPYGSVWAEISGST
ncbi:mediator of RNA polymerase II transcription subunit 8 isoform X2 [Syngnathoides biaculeatus]|uniref:mediator of RNA polymerase II transcription subunit 8 isoform X2 n=1 Tax=Syngnathoides biaculeatus TaxID=300417 RepID=UPI002ADE787F|nr:mediator of RNA polymerase II transcription subunit 8 isoform X2 [Syngnathoides biaculeatus]